MKRILAAALVMVASLASSAEVTAATEPTNLPVWSFFDLVVDDANEQIYISQGATTHSIVVTDLDGKLLGEVSGLFDPYGMALAEDGSVLYVAQPTKENLALVDPVTLQPTGTIEMPAEYCPGTVAVTGQYIIVGLDCHEWGAEYASPPHGAAVLDTQGAGGWLEFGGDGFRGPHLATSPGAQGVVVVWDEHTLTTWDLTTPTPTQIAWKSDFRYFDAGMTPDGQKLIVGTSEPNAHVMSVPDLTIVGRHDTQRFQYGIAITPDGARVATATNDSHNEGIRLHNVGAYKAIRRIQVEDRFVRRGLGVDAAARRIYVITESQGPFLRMYVLPGVGWTKCKGRNPTIIGTNGDDTIRGTPGDDVILARAGNDFIDGRGGDDVICGGRGNDILSGGFGNDILSGGLGSDSVSYASASQGVNVNLASGTATGEGADSLDVENIVGSPHDDVLVGDGAANVIRGGDGADAIDGAGGGDHLIGEWGDDAITGGDGNDDIAGGRGDDWADGGKGRDRLAGQEGFDELRGGVGRDTLRGGSDGDILLGGPGDDVIDGGSDGDFCKGGGGSDSIDGGEGDDLLLGGEGHDSIAGSAGNDTLAGEAGDDSLDGGLDIDSASFASSANRVEASLASGSATGEGSDTMASIEWLVGSPFGDTLIGNSGDNLLDARGGDDDLTGDRGDDFLQGGDGFDTLRAGTGDDLCAEGEVVRGCETVIGLHSAQVALSPYSVFLPRHPTVPIFSGPQIPISR